MITNDIARTGVPESRRLGFFNKKLGGYAISYESALYTAAAKQSLDYSGGYWNFYELSNGGWYCAPQHPPEQYRVEVPTNGYRGAMSADAYGIVCSLLIQNHLCWQLAQRDETMARQLQNNFYQLRDYALNHAESAAIMGAID